MIDAGTEAGARATRRLEEERIIWITTVKDDGTPQSSPVWFLWDGSEFLIYSQPNKPKLRNIQRNRRVALNLNSNDGGGDIVTLSGEAMVDPDASSAKDDSGYARKYREAVTSAGWTPESFAADYSVPIRIRPDSVRVW